MYIIIIHCTTTFTVSFATVQFFSPPTLSAAASWEGGGTSESASGATAAEVGGFGDASVGLAGDGDALGSLAPGGDTGESGPTVLIPPGLVEDILSLVGGKLRGAGVILAGVESPAAEVRPVVKGSGAILR